MLNVYSLAVSDTSVHWMYEAREFIDFIQHAHSSAVCNTPIHKLYVTRLFIGCM